MQVSYKGRKIQVFSPLRLTASLYRYSEFLELQESATLEATTTELNEALALVESMKSIALKKEKQTLEHLNTVTLELNDAKSMIDIMKAEIEKTNTALDQELSSHISTKVNT